MKASAGSTRPTQSPSQTPQGGNTTGGKSTGGKQHTGKPTRQHTLTRTQSEKRHNDA